MENVCLSNANAILEIRNKHCFHKQDFDDRSSRATGCCASDLRYGYLENKLVPELVK
jgi:hypothetical protein